MRVRFASATTRHPFKLCNGRRRLPRAVPVEARLVGVKPFNGVPDRAEPAGLIPLHGRAQRINHVRQTQHAGEKVQCGRGRCSLRFRSRGRETEFLEPIENGMTNVKGATGAFPKESPCAAVGDVLKQG